nr:hypothetical protein Iba_chr13aCG12230 [Ipomoea batatas]
MRVDAAVLMDKAESECQASGKASSACVPSQTANINSPFIFPPFFSSRRYHSGARGLSGGTRIGTSLRSNLTMPTKSSLTRSLSFTTTSSTDACILSLEKANTTFQELPSLDNSNKQEVHLLNKAEPLKLSARGLAWEAVAQQPSFHQHHILFPGHEAPDRDEGLEREGARDAAGGDWGSGDDGKCASLQI